MAALRLCRHVGDLFAVTGAAPPFSKFTEGSGVEGQGGARSEGGRPEPDCGGRGGSWRQ